MTEVSTFFKQPKPPKKPRKRLPARSPKRIAEQPLREAFREAVKKECGYRCVGPDRGLPGACGVIDPTRDALEVHEPDQRSTHPGSHVRSTLAVALCQVHHAYCTSPSGKALEIVKDCGLLVRNQTPIRTHARDSL